MHLTIINCSWIISFPEQDFKFKKIRISNRVFQGLQINAECQTAASGFECHYVCGALSNSAPPHMHGQPVPGTSIMLKIQLYPQGWGGNLHLCGRPHLSCASTKIPLPVAKLGNEIRRKQLGFGHPQAYSVVASDISSVLTGRQEDDRASSAQVNSPSFLPSENSFLRKALYKCTWTCCCLFMSRQPPITGDLQDFLKAQQTFSLF